MHRMRGSSLIAGLFTFLAFSTLFGSPFSKFLTETKYQYHDTEKICPFQRLPLAALSQSVRMEGWCSNPSSDRPKSLGRVVTGSLKNAEQYV